MTAHIVEFESFTEAELETLEFFPEELESIEAELYPNLESISPQTVAKDLEAYFEGDVEAAGLEARGGQRKRTSEKEPLPRQIRGAQYNQARSILAQAGSDSARKSHPKHNGSGFPVGHGTSLLRGAKEDFKRQNGGRLTPNNVAVLRRAAHEMGIRNDSAW